MSTEKLKSKPVLLATADRYCELKVILTDEKNWKIKAKMLGMGEEFGQQYEKITLKKEEIVRKFEKICIESNQISPERTTTKH